MGQVEAEAPAVRLEGRLAVRAIREFERERRQAEVTGQQGAQADVGHGEAPSVVLEHETVGARSLVGGQASGETMHTVGLDVEIDVPDVDVTSSERRQGIDTNIGGRRQLGHRSTFLLAAGRQPTGHVEADFTAVGANPSGRW
jgi:hypothetical protein